MRIREYAKIKDWKDFVKNHPRGNIFQTPEMYDVYFKTSGFEPVLIVAYVENQIVGILLAVIQSEFDMKLSKLSKRSVVRGGPIIKNEDENILMELLKYYNDRIEKNAIYSQFRNFWDFEGNKKAFLDLGFNYNPHLDILFDLSRTEDQLWSEMKRVRRKGINQAYKKDIAIKNIDLSINENLSQVYDILVDVYRRIGLPLPHYDFFQLNSIVFAENILCLGAYVNNELIGFRIALIYNDKIIDWYAGSKSDYLSYRPNDLLPWELIKWGIRNKYKTFSFGGAGKPDEHYGVRDYKLKFGGELVEFGRFEKIHKRAFYRIAHLGLKVLQTFKK